MVKVPGVGNVRMIAVAHVMPVPVRSPMAPSPAKSTVEADANPQAEPNAGSVVVETGKPGPVIKWIERIAVYDPWVVFRNVNEIRIGRFNRDRIALGGDGFLRGAFE